MNKKVDFLVIGGGSGGVRAARLSASFGAKVVLIEKNQLGGTCVNLGCVPKKFFVYASDFRHQFKVAQGYGWDVQSKLNWQKFIANKNKEILRLNSIYQKLLEDNGVEIVFGEAKLLDKNTVQVGEQTYQAEKILIATGSNPFLPKIEGIELAHISDDMFFLPELPQKAVVVGAGYIAVEFAGILNSFGVQTTLIHRNENLLRAFDRETVAHLVSEMKKRGIAFELGCQIEKIQKQNESLLLQLNNGKETKTDLLLYAIGRKPNLDNLALEKIGIELAKNGGISVNSFFQTTFPNIYAIGDIINHINLTPVAIKQAVVVAHHLFNNKTLTLNYKNLPTAVFSQPNLATVGLTEEEAKKQGDVEIFKATPTPMKYSLSESKEKAFLKLIVDKASQKIIGAHMVGADAGEIMQIMAVAIRAGATKMDFDQTIGVHPSLAEEWVTLS